MAISLKYLFSIFPTPGFSFIKNHSLFCRNIFYFLIFFISNASYANSGQTKQSAADSLDNFILSLDNDTSRADALNKLAWSLMQSYPDSFLILNQRSLKISEKAGLKKESSFAYSCLGIYYSSRGNFSKALNQHFRALKFREELKDSSSIANTLGNIGLAYWNLKNHSKALTFFNQSIAIAEKIGNKKIISNQLCNIGLIYWKNLGDPEKALDYFFRSMHIAEEQRDTGLIEVNLGNIGNVYSDIAESATGKKKDEYTLKSMDCYSRALKMSEEMNDINHSSTWLGNIGNLYMDLKKYDLSESHLLSALTKAQITKDVYLQKQWHEQLSKLYELIHKPVKAFEHYRKYIKARDSIYSEQSSLEEVSIEMNYHFEKKEQEAKARQLKKDLLFNEEKKEQKIILFFVIGTIFLVAVFSLFIIKAWLQKKKANGLMMIQKVEIEKKQKEILDSIYYARRIQQSLLPTEKYLERNIKRLMNND